MSTLFPDLEKGLKEALDYEKGQGRAKEKTFTISPVTEYTGEEIREIRIKAGMTQRVFAAFMGVSQKTVEAWECGRTHPTGPGCRLINLISTDGDVDYIIQSEAE